MTCAHALIEVVTETHEIATGASGGDVNTIEETTIMGMCTSCHEPQPIPEEIERMLEQ